MMYREYAPPPHLARHVECFWSVEVNAICEHLILPDGCEDIVFTRASNSLTAVGAMSRAKVHAEEGTVCGARFHPSMARQFLRAPAHELTDQMVDLAGLWGKAGEQLRLRLSSSENAEEMIGLLASALNPAAETSAQSMVLHVVAHGGRLPLADLARFAGLSQRQLRRVFLENTGLAPKVFCRVLRFRGLVEHVVSNVASSGEERWAELALDHGYYDQSHLTNEFRELSGLTPSEYKARL